MDECMPPYDEYYELKRQLDELQSQTVSCCSFAVHGAPSHVTGIPRLHVVVAWCSG